jgi:drug/metabolite transporter (DMT)-like permease
MTGARRPMTAVEWLLLIALSVLWGGSFFFFKVLDTDLPVFTIVLGRVAIAAFLLNLALLLRGQLPTLRELPWRQIGVMALLNNVIPFSLFVFAETRITSGLAAILNATTPAFTVIAAHVLTRDEKISMAKLVGVALGFVGVVLLTGARFGHSVNSGTGLAMAACLVAAMLYAFAGIYGRRFRGVPPIAIASGQITASTMLMLPVALATDHPWTLPIPHMTTIAALVGLAALSTALAYLIYFRLLATAGATNLLLVTVLSPVSALVLGALFLHEAITASALAGLATIGLGLAAIDGRPWTAFRRGARCAASE